MLRPSDVRGQSLHPRFVPVWLGLFAASVALRPALTGTGPLLPRVQRGLEISHSVAGLLPGLLLLLMGLSSLSTPAIINRFGWYRAGSSALLLAGVAGLIRAAVPSAPAVVLMTIPIGIGMGVASTTLPAAVLDLYPPRRQGTATAIHALGVNIGAAGATAVAAPLAGLAGGWRGAFAVFAAAGLLLAAVWLLAVPRGADHRTVERRSLPLGSPHAWLVTCLFALQGLCYYGLGAWLPDAYVERGWSEGAAGALVATITLAAVPSSFLIPRMSERVASRRLPLLISSLGLLTGAIGFTVWPDGGWVWAVLVGISLGGLFSLCLLLAIRLGRPRGAVAGFVGLMLGVGYIISAGAPVFLGALRDTAGSFSAALWLLVVVAACLVAVVGLSRRVFEPDITANATPTPRR